MKFNVQKINAVFSIFMLLIFFVAAINLDEHLSSFVQKNFTFLLIIFLFSISLMLYDLLSMIKAKKDQEFSFSNKKKPLHEQIHKSSLK